MMYFVRVLLVIPAILVATAASANDPRLCQPEISAYRDDGLDHVETRRELLECLLLTVMKPDTAESYRSQRDDPDNIQIAYAPAADSATLQYVEATADSTERNSDDRGKSSGDLNKIDTDQDDKIYVSTDQQTAAGLSFGMMSGSTSQPSFGYLRTNNGTLPKPKNVQDPPIKPQFNCAQWGLNQDCGDSMPVIDIPLGSEQAIKDFCQNLTSDPLPFERMIEDFTNQSNIDVDAHIIQDGDPFNWQLLDYEPGVVHPYRKYDPSLFFGSNTPELEGNIVIDSGRQDGMSSAKWEYYPDKYRGMTSLLDRAPLSNESEIQENYYGKALNFDGVIIYRPGDYYLQNE